MEKIDLSKIRGKWEEWGEIGNANDGTWARGPIAGGDDTIASIELVARKVNELIGYLETRYPDL